MVNTILINGGILKTYYKFHINSDGKVTRLDVGQATY